MRGVDGYYDIIWADVNIEKINAELLEFQNKCVQNGFTFLVFKIFSTFHCRISFFVCKNITNMFNEDIMLNDC